MQRFAIVTALGLFAGLAGAQNLLTNGGFEDVDPVFNEPEGWLIFSNNGGGATVVNSPVRSGNNAIRIDPGTGGFNAVGRNVADPNAEPNDPNPTSSADILGDAGDVHLRGWYNIPGTITAPVVGAKLEFASATGAGVGGTGDILITADTTDGEWVEFSFTVDGSQIASNARRCNVLLFTFGGGEGEIYWDDIEITQDEFCGSSDFNRDGTTNIQDLLSFLNAFRRRC